jgi:hypothetical protein
MDVSINGWQEERATQQVQPRSPRLPIDGCHANRGNLHFMLSSPDNKGGDLDLLLTGEIKPKHRIKFKYK